MPLCLCALCSALHALRYYALRALRSALHALCCSVCPLEFSDLLVSADKGLQKEWQTFKVPKAKARKEVEPK
ncbi:hypothetical protein SUGI_0522780 [Cryptomeria japonica]|nr:hypothetical protein SUGI_0522780 [Cryptomeria japonica]